jgi:hypothetical protein
MHVDDVAESATDDLLHGRRHTRLRFNGHEEVVDGVEKISHGLLEFPHRDRALSGIDGREIRIDDIKQLIESLVYIGTCTRDPFAPFFLLELALPRLACRTIRRCTRRAPSFEFFGTRRRRELGAFGAALPRRQLGPMPVRRKRDFERAAPSTKSSAAHPEVLGEVREGSRPDGRIELLARRPATTHA